MLSKYKSLFLETIETIIVSFIVILLIYSFVASVETVVGSSMDPTFFSGDKILVDKISKNFVNYERGDVVVFRPPNNEKRHYIKRVIGLPSEVIKLYDCKVYISKDGEKFELVEDYLANNECTVGSLEIPEGRSLRIPNDKYALLGDNRDHSVDSRMLGFISRDKIVGTVIFRFWPIDKIGFID
jgi:signal peptidase I